MTHAPKLSAVEVFRSTQGEGYNAGRAAIFFRLSGCNLACAFAEGSVCDTPYQQSLIRGTLDEVWAQHVTPLLRPSDQRRSAAGQDRMMFIITGGEPTMAPQFDALVQRALESEFYVAVETNGTNWRTGLAMAHWLSVSPKDAVPQGSPSPFHNQHPKTPVLHADVRRHLGAMPNSSRGEYRYVIGGADTPVPPMHEAFRHYVSPAVISDGSSLDWRTAFPGFAPGAMERCLEIVQDDPRWRVSVQVHKVMKVR